MSESTIGDGPIDERYRELMNALAGAIDDALNGPALPGLPRQRTTGFALLMFPFGNEGGRCNYISNADRIDMKVLLREQLARFEGMPEQNGTA